MNDTLRIAIIAVVAVAATRFAAQRIPALSPIAGLV